MAQIRIRDAAAYLGVSDDTVRRWADTGTLTAGRDDAGRLTVDTIELAALLKRTTSAPDDPTDVARSARNRFVGIVTEIVADTVMAQVELQCGPFRVVSLMSSEAVRDLRLEVGSIAVAVVKATMVVVETPRTPEPTTRSAES